jgi:excinuclease UvrABC ATPase subunit
VEITKKPSNKPSNKTSRDASLTRPNPAKSGVVNPNGFAVHHHIHRFTDKMFCPNCNITYPEFTTQYFSPNRQEGACPHCHGIGEVLQVDFDKIIEPTSPLRDAILPRRDSNLGQAILKRLTEKYAMHLDTPRKDQPERFLHIILNGDNELIRVPAGGKRTSMYYQGMEEIIKEQYAKGLLTVDFQAMLDMRPCPECFGSKLKKESLHVFLTFPKEAGKLIEKLPSFKDFFIMQPELPFARPVDDGRFKINIRDLQKIQLSEL